MLDGTYRIDRVLGYGGVGVVCAAMHLHVQRPCAVKFLHPYLVSNPELRARFRREAQSAFQLGHPHIVSITDFRDNPDSWPYIVMELVTGETLRSRLERGPLGPRLAVRLMTELCDALHTAHRRGVIHRDLKPENLFLTHASGADDDSDIVLKVLDFGLSKILDESDITESGRLLGSPSYMSPEQARGESHLVDARSDIFSAGVLLYECLTAYKLFEAASFEQKRQMIMAAQLPPLKLVQRGLPAQLETIIQTCCAQRPEDRFQTAAQLADALASVYGDEVPVAVRAEMSGRLVRAPAEPSPRPSGQLPPRQPGFEPMLPASGSDAVPVAGPPPLPPAAAPAPVPDLLPPAPELLPAERSRRRTGVWVLVMVAGMALGGVLALAGYRTLRPGATGAPQTQPLATPQPGDDRPKVAREGGRAVTKAQPPRPREERRPAQVREERSRDSQLEALTIAAVNPVMLAARPQLARCFPPDTAIPRRLQVDLVVAPTGRVRDATADLPDVQQVGCVVDRLLKLRFPAFRGDPTNVHFEFVNMQR